MELAKRMCNEDAFDGVVWELHTRILDNDCRFGVNGMCSEDWKNMSSPEYRLELKSELSVYFREPNALEAWSDKDLIDDMSFEERFLIGSTIAMESLKEYVSRKGNVSEDRSGTNEHAKVLGAASWDAGMLTFSKPFETRSAMESFRHAMSTAQSHAQLVMDHERVVVLEFRLHRACLEPTYLGFDSTP